MGLFGQFRQILMMPLGSWGEPFGDHPIAGQSKEVIDFFGSVWVVLWGSWGKPRIYFDYVVELLGSALLGSLESVGGSFCNPNKSSTRLGSFGLAGALGATHIL